ncbi:hypothetical protein LCGC14_0663900 [marine sediment metagenome]|uniref:Uncharacterized protein n=1 Tax=marine sediment metagenome TaxID=412755 RepID=A0A0F9TE66_9ZZZZ
MVEDMVISKVLSPISERFKKIENNRKYFSYLIQKRFANERMLQLEILNIISQIDEVEDYLPEMPYDLEGKEKCDLWFSLKDGSEYWIELKMIPTNYRKKGHAKAITNGINSIIEDINRLKNIKGKKFVMFAIYPIYPENYALFNNIHLQKISDKVGKDIKMPEISLKIGEADFNLYIFKV